jgi:GNAT superfamily N-acetyltransferase
VEIRWLDPATPDRRDLGGAVAVLEAARVADGRPGLTPTVTSFAGAMRTGWEGDPPLVAVAFDGDGDRDGGLAGAGDGGIAGGEGDGDRRVRGLLELTLPPWDNRTQGIAEITVDPLSRRRGIGRALYAAAVERMRAAGRSVLILEARGGSAGERFLDALGLEVGPGEQLRHQDVTALDWAVLDELYADALTQAADYEIREIPPEAPDDMLTELIAVISAVNDAPMDVRHAEPDRYPPERIRAYEAGEAGIGRIGYRLVARHTPTGVFAGYTGVGVDAERPWYATQYITSVRAEHRGHRLGLLLKIAMTRLLRDREPALRTISTWNSPDNAHMIAVNETLGYRLVGDWVTGVATV